MSGFATEFVHGETGSHGGEPSAPDKKLDKVHHAETRFDGGVLGVHGGDLSAKSVLALRRMRK
jgi:hypothetical protein